MSNIYFKLVKGRKYAYRCLRSWRDESGKVHKQEQYLGAVEPVNRVPIMQQVPKEVQQQLRKCFVDGTMTVSDIRDRVAVYTGNRPSATTVYNFMKNGA